MLGIILFGTKGRRKVVDRGTFTCPSCRSWQSYELHEDRRWFTLYFVPTIPLDRLGQRVRCTGCSGDFGPEVLELTPEQVAAANAPWRCADCDNANPRSEPACLGCGRPA